MVNRRGGAVRQAARERPATLADLAAVRDEIEALDERRRVLVGRRDVLVQALRAGGATWPQLEDAAGASRPALVKRGAGGLPLKG